MVDGSTQSDRNKDRSTNKFKAKIFNEALGSNLDEDQLANLCMENWPGKVYTNTLVTRGNVMEDDSGKDAIIIIQPTITHTEDGTEKFLDVPPEVEAIVKGKELRSGDIVQYTTITTPMTGDGSQHSEQTIFLLAIDPEEEGISLQKPCGRAYRG